MFKFLIVALTIVACTHADNNPNDVHAEILQNQVEINQDGSYKYAYATSNGISGEEVGVGGSYANGAHSYYSPEGQLIQLQYTADENGYQPQAAHLPTPPPIPAAILRSLEYIRTHPQYEDKYSATSQYQQQASAAVQYRPQVEPARAPVQYRRPQAQRLRKF